MSELIKIKEVSSKYNITTRTLRYYEDMGLIISARSPDYAYRMYDADAVFRLEQILILRRLNISIKDIKRIFDASGSEIILEVLSKKVDDIDNEVALLHELKEIVLEFIEQINQADFSAAAVHRRLPVISKHKEAVFRDKDWKHGAIHGNAGGGTRRADIGLNQ